MGYITTFVKPSHLLKCCLHIFDIIQCINTPALLPLFSLTERLKLWIVFYLVHVLFSILPLNILNSQNLAHSLLLSFDSLWWKIWEEKRWLFKCTAVFLPRLINIFWRTPIYICDFTTYIIFALSHCDNYDFRWDGSNRTHLNLLIFLSNSHSE